MSSSLEGLPEFHQPERMQDGQPSESKLSAGEQLARHAVENSIDQVELVEHIVSPQDATLGEKMDALDEVSGLLPDNHARLLRRDMLLLSRATRRPSRRSPQNHYRRLV